MILAIIGFADLIPLFVFAGFVMFIWAILGMISKRNSHMHERLARLSRPACIVPFSSEHHRC